MSSGFDRWIGPEFKRYGWEGNEIGAALAKKAIAGVLREKYRYLVENAIPYFRVAEVAEEEIP